MTTENKSLFDTLAEAASPFNYYKAQLKEIGSSRDAKMKISDYLGETNWMYLTDESASVLVKWLKDNFNVSE